MKFYIAMIAVVLFAASVTSCSPNEDLAEEQEQGEEFVFDQVKYFQDYFVNLDSLGNFILRVNGAKLNPADSTELYIGVADLNAAAEMFKEMQSPDTEVRLSAPSTIDMEADLRDKTGQCQETVYFRVTDESPTLAEITFAKGNVIKYVSKVIFIKESAWPDNNDSPYLIGDDVYFIRDFGTWKGRQRVRGMCIREKKNGVSGLVLYVGDKVKAGAEDADLAANATNAKEASKVLRQDWDTLADMLGHDRLKRGEFYWIKEFVGWPPCGGCAIRLSDGKIEGFAFYREKHFIEVYTF